MSTDDAPARRSRPGRDVLVSVAVAVLAAAAAWSRLDATTRGTLWAEDGRVFVLDAWGEVWWRVLLEPYGGYLHLVPRVLAELAVTVVPTEDVAVAVTALSCAVAGAVAGVVHACAASVTPSRGGRLALAALTVVVPAAGVEVLGNLANLHWFFLWATPWLLLHRPRTRTGAAALGLLGLAAALTEVQVAYFLPLAVLGLRERRCLPVRAGLLIGLGAQAVAVLTVPRGEAVGLVPGVDVVAAGYLVDVVLPVWLGTPETVTVVLAGVGWGAAVLALVPTCLAAVLVARRATGTERTAGLVLPVFSVVTWAIPVLLNRAAFDWSRPDPGDPAVEVIRYAVVASMLLVSGIVLAARHVPRRRWARVPAVLVALTLTAASVHAWQVPGTQRQAGPSWQREVADARRACSTPDVVVELEAAPDAHWTVRVPCGVLDDG